MMKNLLMALFFCCFSFMNAQQLIKPAEMIENVASKRAPEKINLFKTVENQSQNLRSTLDKFVVVDFKKQDLEALRSASGKFIEIDVPISQKESVTLQLVKIDLFEDNDYVITYPSEKEVSVDPGTHYRGIVKGKPETLVAFSVFDDEVMGLASGLYGSNLVIGKIKDQKNHVIYLDNQIAKHNNFSCTVQDDNVSYKAEELQSTEAIDASLANKCVRFYVEINFDLYQNRGSEAATSNFAVGLMNQVGTLYANENINTKLMPLAIWTQYSPYTASDTGSLMRQFQNYRSSWNGDLAQLWGMQGNGGIAAGFDGICNSYRSNSMSYSDVQPYYNIAPTYSWSTQLVTHEYGHIMGSRHTHACVWNGNGTAIDGCAGYVEGNCYRPGYPSGGGTIMSYCHMTNVGISHYKGFGTQPGNAIRYKVANGSCLQSCEGGPIDPDPDPDPTPDECDETAFNVIIKTDNYPRETTWAIFDESGERVVRGYGYTARKTTYNEEVCLPAGCYTFEIYDSEGDGICCGYGEGSYEVTFDGETLLSGGNFGAEETGDFCIGKSNPGPDPDPDPSCIESTVVIFTDNYPEETSWELKDANGRVISGAENLSGSNEELTFEECLEPGCYTLTFYDSYGDGFCCNYGNGWYEFFEGEQVKFSQWANFYDKISYQVCVGNNATESNLVEVKDEIPPFTAEFKVVSPFSETLDIRFNRTKENVVIKDLKVTDMNGTHIFTKKDLNTNQLNRINTSAWPKGVYILTFTKDNQQESVKVIKK